MTRIINWWLLFNPRSLLQIKSNLKVEERITLGSVSSRFNEAAVVTIKQSSPRGEYRWTVTWCRWSVTGFHSVCWHLSSVYGVFICPPPRLLRSKIKKNPSAAFQWPLRCISFKGLVSTYNWAGKRSFQAPGSQKCFCFLLNMHRGLWCVKSPKVHMKQKTRTRRFMSKEIPAYFQTASFMRTILRPWLCVCWCLLGRFRGKYFPLCKQGASPTSWFIFCFEKCYFDVSPLASWRQPSKTPQSFCKERWEVSSAEARGAAQQQNMGKSF